MREGARVSTLHANPPEWSTFLNRVAKVGCYACVPQEGSGVFHARWDRRCKSVDWQLLPSWNAVGKYSD